MNTRRIQPDIELLSPEHRAMFEASNKCLREAGDEECTVSEFLKCRIDDAIEQAERVASRSMLGAFNVQEILLILRGKQ